MKNKKRDAVILGLIGLTIAFIIGMEARGSSEGILFDLAIMDLIHKSSSSIGLSIMKIITLLGSKEFLIIAGSGAFIYFVNLMERRNARMVLASIAGSYALNAILKIIFSRTRPLVYMLVEKGGYSFPSGHSMVSMSFYTTITYILLEKVKDKKIRTLMWIANFVIIGLIGFSRLYLGVHWPTDVIVGYVLGFITFIIIKDLVK